MPLDLPEGIYYNKVEEVQIEVELPQEVVEKWNCNNCGLVLESLVVGENGRYQGQIQNGVTKAITWHGVLPKNQEKALKYLSDTLQQKTSRHNLGH